MARSEITKITSANKQEGEELVPKIMMDYLDSLTKQNNEWEIAVKKALERRDNNNNGKK